MKTSARLKLIRAVASQAGASPASRTVVITVTAVHFKRALRRAVSASTVRKMSVHVAGQR